MKSQPMRFFEHDLKRDKSGAWRNKYVRVDPGSRGYSAYTLHPLPYYEGAYGRTPQEAGGWSARC